MEKTFVLFRTYKYNAFDYLIYFMVATSSFLVIQVRGQELLMLLQTLFCVVMLFYYKKIYFVKNVLVNLIFLCMAVTMIFTMVNDIRYSYTRTAVYMTIVAIPVYFSAAYFGRYLKDHPSKWEVIRNALKLMCVVQMSWCLLQFVLYRAAGIDLNRAVFVDFLHIIENASFYKGGTVFMPTGLCWHPIIMAPVLILAYYLFNNFFIKLFALLEALFIGNSTVLIAVFLCIVLDVIYHVWHIVKKGEIRKSVVIGIIAVLSVLAVVLYFTGMIEAVFEKFLYVFQRISGGSTDLSTEAHIRYYTAYQDVFRISRVSQIFFGYGEGCSGYPYSVLFGQYKSLGNWAVETDIMNILISRGLIGFLLFYSFLAQIIIRGGKIDYRYAFVTAILALSGITYNVQFSWVVFLELLLITALSQGISLFGRTGGEEQPAGHKKLLFRA